MATILRSHNHETLKYGSTQFRYGMTYVLITFVVLSFLNIYTSNASKMLFYRSKQSSMQDKAQLVASAIAEEDMINEDTVGRVLTELDNLKVTRLIVTNQAGIILYDSLAEGGFFHSYSLYPEIVDALHGNDAFTCRYHNGAIESQAAVPILSYNTLNGCVYIMEYDSAQGKLIGSLQVNMLTTTLILEFIILLFSLGFSEIFSRRMRKIIHSIQVIRDGDYTHKVELRGHDEFSILGEQFNDLTDRLNESEARRQQFVSDASHELKTPLASIKLLSDTILQNDMDTETIREFVSDIGDEADRLNRMTLKLLSLTRGADHSSDDCEIIYIGPTISRVARMLSAIADNQAVTLKINIVEDCSILVYEDDLYQIIFNLVENGIKYNRPGGKLYIELKRVSENALLTVKDTGVGIPQNSLDHIFERFYRVDKARARKNGGSGLGLSIVWEMVHRNHGNIQVISQTGDQSGTTFTLQFPIFDIDEEDS